MTLAMALLVSALASGIAASGPKVGCCVDSMRPNGCIGDIIVT